MQFPRFQADTLTWLQGILPAVQQAYSPAFGVVYVQIETQTEQDAGVVIEALFSGDAAPYAKIVVVVDTDVDIFNPEEVAWVLGSRVRPDRDLIIKPDLPGLIIDPSTLGSEETGEQSRLQTRTAKLGIDATKPVSEREKYEKVDVPSEVRLKVARMLGL